jgi:hypothetical protein
MKVAPPLGSADARLFILAGGLRNARLLRCIQMGRSPGRYVRTVAEHPRGAPVRSAVIPTLIVGGLTFGHAKQV